MEHLDAARESLPAARRTPHVLAWLIVPMLLATLIFVATGRLSSPEYRPDTESYLEVARNGVFTKSALQSPRTFGYPLFLQLVEAAFGSLSIVPVLHWAGLCAAIAFFAFALLHIGAPPLLCMTLTSPLFFSDVAAAYLPVLLTEVPSLALAVASMAAVVLAAHEPSRGRWWAILAATVFLAYQIRPAYLFLIAAVPLIVLLLDPLLCHNQDRRPARWRIAATAATAVAMPFLGFCSLRLILVGHFGLVSFAGTNVVGVAGTILNEAMLPQLSPNVRGLAEAMLQIRASSELQEVAQARQASWDQTVRRRFGLDLPDYETMHRLYDPTIHQVAYPAARRIYGDDQVAANRAFSDLSREILTLRPITYAAWVAIGFYRAVVTSLSLYLMLAMIVLAAGIFLFRRGWDALASGNAPAAPQSFALAHAESKVFSVVATVAIMFFGAKTLLVALVEPTLARYVRPAAVFLPTIPAMAIYCQVRRLAQHKLARAIATSQRKPALGSGTAATTAAASVATPHFNSTASSSS